MRKPKTIGTKHVKIKLKDQNEFFHPLKTL